MRYSITTSSFIFSLLSLIILFTQTTTSAHESENNHLAENENKQACRSSEDVDNTGDEISAMWSTSRAIRDQRRQLPPEYIEQLKEVDDYLRMEEENIDPIITCDEYLNLHDFVDPVDASKSLYQEITWAENPAKSDKCLTLDNTLQICNSYRPHYHEFFVHFPASFLPQMRRAIFVGGGDSMLLHELLHYPEIELIVGLELDQVVVRDSFRHFFTQPHFDNPKVQWWFGDAAKSLRMIPSTWYGTFDLVMVDLSETVMSMSVSEELDILKALAMLVNPSHGVFIKNERYMRELNKIFHHVIQIYLPDTPLLCDQDWVLGSHGIDFLQPDFDRLLKKYNIPTLIYRPNEDTTMHYELIREYSTNDSKTLEICKNEATKRNEFLNSGLMMVVEAENANYITSRKFQLSDAIEEAVKGIKNLHMITSKTFIQDGGTSALILLREGYITARARPNHYYCAVDIALWASFDQLEPIRDAILHIVGSSQPRDWSSFVMIVGGMLGMGKAANLYETGPQWTPYDKCEEKVETNSAMKTIFAECSLDSMQIALNESISLLSNTMTVAVVFCGVHGVHRCNALEVLQLQNNISHVLVLWNCPKDGSMDSRVKSTNRLTSVVLCKATPRAVIQETVSILGQVGLVVIDISTPSTTVLDAANSLCNIPVYLETSFLAEKSLFIIPYVDQIGDYFLEICRLELDERLLRVAEMSMQKKASVYESMGFLSLGNPLFLAQLANVMKNVEIRTDNRTNLKYMKSVPMKQQYPYTPLHFTASDFDEYPGMMQYARQTPLGKQSILQMQFAKTDFTRDLLEERITEFFRHLDIEPANTVFENVASGVVAYGVHSTGHAMFVWDGGSSIDLNIFSLNESTPHEEAFVEFFMNEIDPLSNLTLSEHFPRGVMKVINFSEDITASPGCVDRYLLCETFATNGGCEDKVDVDWMEVNCPKSCKMCPGGT